MRLSVPRLRWVLLGAGFLAGMAAAFAAGMCFPARSPAVCTQADLTVRPDAAPFSPAVSTMATAETQPNAALPEKWVCLTFDDGPSKTTPDVLSALNAAGVHGTFFVVATDYNEKYLPLLTEAAATGHQIALHSASHEYSDIYRSSEAYWADIALLKERIARIVLPPVCTFAAIMAAGWGVTGGAGWLWLAALASGGVLLGRCMEKWL